MSGFEVLLEYLTRYFPILLFIFVALVFGVLKILNVAHGELLMLGGLYHRLYTRKFVDESTVTTAPRRRAAVRRWTRRRCSRRKTETR